MKKALVVLIIMMLATALLFASALAQTEGRKISLVTREVSLGKVHAGITKKGLATSPDSKRVAYGAKQGDKWFLVVDGVEGKEYDGFLHHVSKLVFDSPKSLHALVRRGDEIFRVEMEMVEE